MIDDLDSLPSTFRPPKEVTLKTLKKETNKAILTAMERLTSIMNNPESKDTAVIAASNSIIKLHLTLIDKEQQAYILDQQRKMNTLRLSKMASDAALVVGDGDYQKNTREQYPRLDTTFDGDDLYEPDEVL